jgi:hypothetical protein
MIHEGQWLGIPLARIDRRNHRGESIPDLAGFSINSHQILRFFAQGWP